MENNTTAKKFRLVIEQDCDVTTPREFDNFSVMVCGHRRYSLGDKGATFPDGQEFGDFESLEEAEQAITEQVEKKGGVVLPLYLYDHSGITMNTTGFSCRWDSGQVGFIFATREKILKEYNRKKISKKLLQKVQELLVEEVRVYDQWLTGDVYLFRVEDVETGDTLDACAGFYGRDPKENGMDDHLEHPLEAYEIVYK